MTFSRLLLVFLLIPFLTNAQAAKPATLDAFKFIEGHWRGIHNGGPIEASWTAPEANNIMGSIRMMKDNKISLYEVLVYEQTEAGPVSLVKHFKAGLIGMEEKDKSDRYRFVEASDKEVLLEKDDASIRIIYEKRAPDQLVIRRGEKKGADWAFNDLFVFNRVK